MQSIIMKNILNIPEYLSFIIIMKFTTVYSKFATGHFSKFSHDCLLEKPYIYNENINQTII